MVVVVVLQWCVVVLVGEWCKVCWLGTPVPWLWWCCVALLVLAWHASAMFVVVCGGACGWVSWGVSLVRRCRGCGGALCACARVVCGVSAWWLHDACRHGVSAHHQRTPHAPHAPCPPLVPKELPMTFFDNFYNFPAYAVKQNMLRKNKTSCYLFLRADCFSLERNTF